jgi:peptidoglycan/LPS O-acetylase OafA/YrhL
MAQTAVSGKHGDYIPALDGLRAVSILLVVGSHAGLDHVLPGAFGVTLFFFISGMLITGQLLRILQTDGRLHLAGFYARRLLRLTPAALAYTLLAGAGFSLAGGRITAGGWAAALFYGANYYDLWAGYRTTLAGVRHPFNILWSLAIEDHFYAIWPALLGLLWRGRLVAVALVAVCVLVLCWRAFLYGACFHAGAPGICGLPRADALGRFNRLYLATDTRIDSIAYGALLAAAGRTGRLATRAAGPALALLAASFLLPGDFARQVMRTSLQGVALLALVPAVMAPGSATARILSATPAVAIGRLSYSLYLWHWGAFAIADLLAIRAGAARYGLVWQAIALPLAAALALLCYQCIERPMLALRRRAGSHAPLNPLTETPNAAA